MAPTKVVSDMHLNILILENDLFEQERCRILIESIIPGCKILCTQRGRDARDVFMGYNIDAAFIDMSFTDIDGLELLKEVRNMPQYKVLPMFFMIKKDNSAIEMYKKSLHIAFISKPYSDNEFIEKVSDLLDGIKNIKANNFLEARMGDQSRRVKIISNGVENFIYIFDILFAESSGHTLVLHTREGTLSDIKTTLEELINIIDDDMLVRCHKSFAVNIRNVHSIVRINDKVHELNFDTNDLLRCFIGNTYYHKVKEACENYQNPYQK